ncbi:MAG: type IV pilus modification PilV family protein [Mobilitalea sp.]
MNQKGFTLIEVVISIAILTILIVPALSGFTSAAKVNRNAQISQKSATLAGNLMETIKNNRIEELTLEFNGVNNFQIINSNLNGYIDSYQMKPFSENGFGEYVLVAGSYLRVVPGDGLCSVKSVGLPPVYTYEPPAGRGKFTFGIENLLDGGYVFDALITLDATIYRDSVKYPEEMNNYKMPNIMELEEKNLIILDLEGYTTSWSDNTESALYDNTNSTDHQALEYFKNIQSAYLEYLESLIDYNVSPSPLPIPSYSEDEIKAMIAKEIKVNLYKNSIKQTVQVDCKVIYSCNLDLNSDGNIEIINFNLFSKSSQIPVDSDIDTNIYLLYTPSDFLLNDTITVTNDGARAKFTISKQEGTLATGVKINKVEEGFAITSIFTNLSTGDIDAGSISNITGHTLITKGEAVDRIYDIRVSVFEAGSIASGTLSDPLTTFTSSGENKK